MNKQKKYSHFGQQHAAPTLASSATKPPLQFKVVVDTRSTLLALHHFCRLTRSLSAAISLANKQVSLPLTHGSRN